VTKKHYTYPLPALCAWLFTLSLCACGSAGPDLASADNIELHVISSLESAEQDFAQYSLKQSPDAGGLVLDLQVKTARGLRAYGVEISYDPQRWHPVSMEGSELLGPRAAVLQQGMDVEPGLLAFGAVQIAGGPAQPFNGQGNLASIRLEPGPGSQPRRVAAINLSSPDVQWDEAGLRLSWLYGNTGDYDQNSEVNIADLTPVGMHFRESSADPLAALAMIDGDGNGEINIADITPIGINYGNGLSAYRLWELSSPLDWQGVELTAALLDIPFGDASGAPSIDRLSFEYVYGADPGYRWLRLAAVNGAETGSATQALFSHPSLQPIFSLADASGISGSGTAEDPYVSSAPASHALHLEKQDATDVTDDGLSAYLLSGPVGASLTGSLLEFSDTAAGDYYVTASYDGVPSEPYSLHFHLNVAPLAVLTASPASGHVPFDAVLDASASSDPDGSIVLVEWDFDNDGTFDADSGSALTIAHRYPAEGTYSAVVRLTDDAGATALSAPLELTVLPPNQAPQAELTGFPLSGNTPLTVSFDASASTDADGTVVVSDWDFDNDGVFELTEVPGLEANHVYTVPGEYAAVVRVYDDDGASALSAPVQISVGGNFPPLAVLRALPSAGPSPLLVLLDATKSSDPDGEIVLVEWDFSGDGEYDASGTQLSISRSYTGDGEFQAIVRLTDNDGGVSVSDPVSIQVGVSSGSAPLALLSADPAFGSAPLLVSLDAGGSTDPDGDIVLAEFDFDNDGSWDEEDSEDFVTTHTYAADGSYAARVRITDAQGHRTTSAPVSIIVSSGSAPTAAYTAISFSGSVPFDVVADASTSSDPDGPLALYEWDADDNGIYEYATSQSSAQFSLVQTGSQTIRLRVTDGDGLTHSVSHVFTALPGSLQWKDYSTGIVNPLGARYAVSGGRPSVAWQSSGADIFFKRSADSAGHSWPVSGNLVDGSLAGYPGGSIRLLDFAISGGVPLFVSIKGTDAEADQDMFVSRGLNSDGSSFSIPLKIVSGFVNRVDRDQQGWPLLADFSGLPGISYGSSQSGKWQHIRALDSQGADWPETPESINGSQASAVPFGSLLQDPAGGATLLYFSDGGIQANRDPDGDGAGWNFRQDLHSIANVKRVQAISSAGSILMLYTSESSGIQTLYASHADAPAFTSWSNPVQVAALSSGAADAQLLLDGGKPVLLLSGNLLGLNGVLYLRSHDALGSHWSLPLQISTVSGGELRGVAHVNGRLTALHLRGNGSLRLLSRE
jgi:PKD repeat protein